MARQTTILVIEDEPKTSAALRLYLEHAGFRVLQAFTGNQALALAREKSPDLILLDLMLPELDGVAICRTLRAESDVPVVMVTAKTTEEDKLRGLNIGADDYITKPFSPREVVARVQAVLRRATGIDSSGPAVLRWKDVLLERSTRQVTAGETLLKLTPAEFRLLETFLRSPGRVFSREELLEKIGGKNSKAFDRTVDAHVKNLRAKLNATPSKSARIETVHGVGYKLAGDDPDV